MVNREATDPEWPLDVFMSLACPKCRFRFTERTQLPSITTR